MQSYSKLIIIGVAAVAATAGLWYLYKRSNKDDKTIADDEEDNEEEVKNNRKTGKTSSIKKKEDKSKRDTSDIVAVSEEKTIEVLRYIRAAMEPNSMGFMAMKAQFGQQMSEAELNRIIETEFKNSLNEVTNKAYAEFNVTEEEMKKAQEKYKNVKEVKHLGIAINNMYAAVLGREPELCDIPAVLTKELVMDILKQQYSNSTSVMQDQLSEVAKQKNMSIDNLKLAIQRDPNILQNVTDTATNIIARRNNEIFRKYNITNLEFDSALSRYNNDPSFSQELSQLFMQASSAGSEFFGMS